MVPITEKEKSKWIKYAQKHTAIEFSMYMKYSDRYRLQDEDSSCLEFWRNAQLKTKD